MAPLPHVGAHFGRYRVDDRIGVGAMGVVYAATDRRLERRVALKVLSPSLSGSPAFLQRFAREAALLARLDSAHVVTIYDYGEIDGCPFLATQYIPGGDLGALLRVRGPMPPRLAADVCAQVAEGLADVHRVGVVHRDVKPSNVLLDEAGDVPLTAYLCDFGIARTESDGLATAGTVSGTWGYLAPEVGLGQPATASSDLYAVGCLLWAALFGSQPYRGTDAEVVIAHQRSPVPRVAGRDPFSRRLNAVLNRCLAKDPGARYADASELAADLAALAATPSDGVLSADEAHAARPAGASHWRGGRGAAVGAAAGVLVAAGVAGAVAHPWWSRSGPADGVPATRSAASLRPAPTAPHRVQGDLDGDGYGDVRARVLRASGSYLVTTWLSTGKRLQAPVTISAAAAGPDPRAVQADLDGDGRPERLFCRAGPGTLTCRSRLSGGGLANELIAVPADVRSGLGVRVGDVDGDGRDDLVLIGDRARRGDKGDRGTAAALSVDVALGHGTAFGAARPWGTVPLRAWSGSPAVGLSDVDGDGMADLVVVGQVSNSAGLVRVGRSGGRSFALLTTWGAWPLHPGHSRPLLLEADGRR